MNHKIIDHNRRRAIKLAAYTTIPLSFSGVPVTVMGAEDSTLASENESLIANSQNTSKEVYRGYVIEINTPQVSSSRALPEREANATVGEVLLVDGKSIPYLKNTQGYHIYYQPPEDSLIKAARSFIETQREK
ncbi:MAG: hypothetical protein KAH20_08650 [Methylococcales bacterium]|nr:hypothetical protein [Methylococcales bacterium]